MSDYQNIDMQLAKAAILRPHMHDVVKKFQAKIVIVPTELRFLARAVFGAADSPGVPWMIVHGATLENNSEYPLDREHTILKQFGLPPLSMQPGTWAFLGENGCLYIRSLADEIGEKE